MQQLELRVTPWVVVVYVLPIRHYFFREVFVSNTAFAINEDLPFRKESRDANPFFSFLAFF